MINKDTYTILCSSNTLGVYVPAMVVDTQLKDKGCNTDVVILEKLYTNIRQEKIPGMKKAFHQNFAFALMGQKIKLDLDSCLDHEKVETLIQTWINEDRKEFVVFSGYWIPIIENYLTINKNKDIRVTICHMDVTAAASWKNFNPQDKRYKEIWLFNIDNKKIISYINIAGNEPLSYQERENRIILHGGGWGIGTYKNVLEFTKQIPFHIDVIAYDDDDLKDINNSCTYYKLDPDWKPYKNNTTKFPPLGKVIPGSDISYKNNKKYSAVYPIIAKNKAIISKPGGATLIDSLSAATPIIFLDAFGKYEEKNAELWTYHGFGISFNEWKKNDFSPEILNKLHLNILTNRKQLTNLIDLIDAARN